MTPRLTLIRGLPGSGKSTMAKAMQEDGENIHLEADMWFERDEGYVFDASELNLAHQWCQRCALDFLNSGYSIVVSNTFSRVWEMQPYLDMGYPVDVITATGDYGSVHGVPADVIERMRSRWEAYP
jgi:predicted kinase